MSLQSTAAAAFLLLVVLASDAFAASHQHQQSVVTACGMSSALAFKTWSGLVKTHAPVLFPQNDHDLRDILERARNGGCKVRPTGSTMSAPSSIMEETFESDTVVVSLDEYVASDPEWAETVLIHEGAESATVRASAGMTQLDLYSFIRPKHYFLPTITPSYFFTLGGLVANFVHGSSFGKGPYNDYVQSMRVMLHDGNIKHITDKEELRYWRNSYGLLGIILNVELIVVKRPHFRTGIVPKQSLSGGWNQDSFDAHINHIKEEYTAGEWFLDPYTKEFVVIVQNDLKDNTRDKPVLQDSDCIWNVWNGQCEPSKGCSYQYNFGDWSVHDSCRTTHSSLSIDDEYPPPSVATMKQTYHELIRDNPMLGVTGPNIEGGEQTLVRLASRAGLEHLLPGISFSTISQNVKESYETRNDGFWPEASLPLTMPLLEYLVKPAKLFQVLTDIIDLKPEVNMPLEWRFVTFDEKDSAHLNPGNIQFGEWACVQLLTFDVPGHKSDGWRDTFLEVERILQQAGGTPHPAKYFGMAKNSDGMVQPFVDVPSNLLYNEAQKQEFREYARMMDLEERFWSGFMADYISTY